MEGWKRGPSEIARRSKRETPNQLGSRGKTGSLQRLGNHSKESGQRKGEGSMKAYAFGGGESRGRLAEGVNI